MFFLIFSGCEEECYWSAHCSNFAIYQTRSPHYNCLSCTGLCIWQGHFGAHHIWLWRSRNDGNGNICYFLAWHLAMCRCG